MSQGVKKLLRRKPPPGFEEEEDVQSIEAFEPIFTVPNYTSSSHGHSPIPPYPPVHYEADYTEPVMQLSPNSQFSGYQDLQYPPASSSNTYQSPNGYTQPMPMLINTNDDSSIDDSSFFSFESPKPMGPKELPEFITPKKRYSLDRKFQQMSSTSVPKIHELDDDRSFELSPSAKTQQIINNSMSMNKIPTLHKSTSLNNARIPGGFSPSSSPPREARRYKTINAGPTSPSSRRTSISPTRAQTLLIPNARSPRGSPNNSPKAGRSPSLTYGFNSGADDFQQYSDTDDEDNRTVDLIAAMDINENYYDDFLETRENTPFDYTILPDLPSTLESLTSLPNVVNSVSQRNSLLSSFALPVIPKKRKEEALPMVPLDLPQLPFTSSSLVSGHFSTCENVWSLSNIFKWCCRLAIWLHDQFIPKGEFNKALIKLLAFHRRELPLDLVVRNVEQIVTSLVSVGAVTYEAKRKSFTETDDFQGFVKEAAHKEIGVTFNKNAYVSGVLTDLTRCYYRAHHKDTTYRCYSTHCYLNRTIDHEIQLKNTNINEIVLGEDWASHWKLSTVDLKGIDPQMSTKQSLIFDLLRYEQTFIERAACFVDHVGPAFIKAARVFGGSEIILLNKFEDDMIMPGAELLRLHRKELFVPLLRILIADGRFITNMVDIADIYYKWSIQVTSPLLRYMSTFPMIEDLLTIPLLNHWVEENVSKMKRVQELKVNGHILLRSTFNSRYQQAPLQLSDIRKFYDSLDPEFAALTKALDAIKRLGSKVNEMKLHADNIHELNKIKKQVVWKAAINQPFVNLNSENRRFLFRGEVTRKGDLKINSIINHLILLDNYLLITEKVKGQNIGTFRYKIVENPIPIELLLLEEKDNGSDLARKISPISAPQSAVSVEPVDDSLFPFKIRYAGRGKHDSYTFSTKTERERAEWILTLTTARSKLCKRLKSAEPYNLKMISNTNFAYESNNRVVKLPICAPNDPVYDMSQDSLMKLQAMGYTNDLYSFSQAKTYVVYSAVFNYCTFVFSNSKYHLIGLASGLYCSDGVNRWKKVIHGVDITKTSVDSSTNLVVILGNKHLRYYPLDLIINVYYEKKLKITSVSLSNEPVSFFSIGRHKETTMLFYAKKSSGSTNFKVLIPETDNDGVFSSFKVVKKFYIQAECYGISIFNTSFAVHTNKGFEILELDKLLPRSIPEIPLSDLIKKIDAYSRKSLLGPGVDIKKIIHASKPMGMFKLTNNAEFLLVYSDCAVFTNKHGKLSRYLILKFEFKAKGIAFRENHLFIVCEEAIEIWAINDDVSGSNKLKQVLTGKDISMIDSELLSFAMANPIVPGLQNVFKLEAK